MADDASEHEHIEPLFSDETWDQFTDYADQVTVCVRFKEWIGADYEDESWLLVTNGAAWPKDWLKRQLVELAVSGAGGCCGSGSYQLEATERTTEWGASGVSVEILLTVATSVLSNAAWQAFVALSAKLRDRLEEKFGPWEYPEDLADARVQEAALSAVVRSSSAGREALDVLSVEALPDGGISVDIRERPSGATYTVEVKMKSGSVYLSRIRKIMKRSD